MNTHLLDQARQLSVDEQLELVEALWDDIAKRNAVPPLTDAQKAELDRRLADHEANPDDVIPWSEVKASALARIPGMLSSSAPDPLAMTTSREHALALEEYKSLRQEVLERLARVAKYHHGLLLGTAYYALSAFLVPALKAASAGAMAQSLIFVLPFLALAVDIACVSEMDGIRRAGIYIRDHIERVWKQSQYEGWETWLTAQDLTHRRRTSDRLLDKARRGIVLMYCVLSALIMGQLLSLPTGLLEPVREADPWVISAAVLFTYLLAASLSFVYLEHRRRQEFSRAKYDVFILDVDGCLLNNRQEITDANRTALREIQETGVSIVLASGRSTVSLAAIAADAGLYGLHIASHGASVLHITSGNKARGETRAGMTLPQVRLIGAKLTSLFPDTNWVAIQADGDHYTEGTRMDAVRQSLVSSGCSFFRTYGPTLIVCLF